ncbi:MAG TPA: LPS assembly lipoprotein LptE [Rhodocyclaceae bacterium]|nr:LPS assembly lipoprotein LptE [Rhodocyclaceae bacterium]
MKRLIVVATLLLSACGFHLRGAYSMPFDTLYIALPETADLRAVIKRTVEASTQTRVVDDAKDAQATLQILADLPEKKILALNSAGRVREYQLTRTFVFKVTDGKSGEYLPQSTLAINRDMTFDDSQVLAKAAEETLLWRDIQNDLVQQLLRRLAAAKLRPAASAQ